jgi:type II secretory pathway pseudopilin PulG
MPIALNNRNKAGFFVVALVTGLCLVMGASFHEALGGAIIGMALTWAFGLENRRLWRAIGILGLLTFLVPSVLGIISYAKDIREYRESLETFHLQLKDYAREHPNTYGRGLLYRPPSDPHHQIKRTINVPNTGSREFSIDATDREIAAALRNYPSKSQPPDWFYEALDDNIDPVRAHSITFLPMQHPEPLDLMTILTDGLLIEISALLVAAVFLGSLLADHNLFPRQKQNER